MATITNIATRLGNVPQPEAKRWEVLSPTSFQRPIQPGLNDSSIDYVVVSLNNKTNVRLTPGSDLKEIYKGLKVDQYSEQLHTWDPKKGGYKLIDDYWG